MFKSGKQWPIFIAVAIFGVLILGYWTIKETMKADLAESNLYMSSYQNVDDSINDILEANIKFDKNYSLRLVYHDINTRSTKITYMLRDKSGKAVNNAQVQLIVSRPADDAKDMKFSPSNIEDGKYIFENIHLPKEGRWDLLLKVQIDKNTRYLNYKVDTRNKKITEF